jgi:protein-disulfide isomerase
MAVGFAVATATPVCRRKYMWFTRVMLCVLLAFGLMLFDHGGEAAEKSDVPFPTEQRQAIEQIIREYLMRNPEVLRDVAAELERRNAETQKAEQDKVLKQTRDALSASRGSITLGNPNGKVALVQFSDYNCPFCRASVDDIQKLIKANPQLKVIMREFPILGPESIEASRAALAVNKQLQDLELRGKYYLSLMKVRGVMNGELALSSASKLGLDAAQARKDIRDPDIDLMLRENLSLGEAIGITGTPSFVIGDEILVGAVGFERIQDAISRAYKLQGRDQ